MAALPAEIIRLYKSSPERYSGWARTPDRRVFIFSCDMKGQAVVVRSQLHLNHPKGSPNWSVNLSDARRDKIEPQVQAALDDYRRAWGMRPVDTD